VWFAIDAKVGDTRPPEEQAKAAFSVFLNFYTNRLSVDHGSKSARLIKAFKAFRDGKELRYVQLNSYRKGKKLPFPRTAFGIGEALGSNYKKSTQGCDYNECSGIIGLLFAGYFTHLVLLLDDFMKEKPEAGPAIYEYLMPWLSIAGSLDELHLESIKGDTLDIELRTQLRLTWDSRTSARVNNNAKVSDRFYLAFHAAQTPGVGFFAKCGSVYMELKQALAPLDDAGLDAFDDPF
jgi:hypothetical protein